MLFIFPIFFLSLVSIIIPIIIHFFLKKNKNNIKIGSLEFLKKIKKKKIVRRINDKLLLLVRLLILIFMILIFVTPLLIENQQDRKKNLFLIDRSESMSANTFGISKIEEGRNRVKEIIKTLPMSSINEFYLFNETLEKINKNKLDKKIETFGENDYKKIFNWIKKKQKINNYDKIYFITDGQILPKKKQYLDLNLSMPIEVIVLKSEVFNVNIKNVYSEDIILRKKNKIDVFLEISGEYSNQRKIGNLIFEVNNKKQKKKIIFDENKNIKKITFYFTPQRSGTSLFKLFLDVKDSYQKDNTYYGSFSVENQKNILILDKKDYSYFFVTFLKSYRAEYDFAYKVIKSLKGINTDKYFLTVSCNYPQFPSIERKKLNNFVLKGGHLFYFLGKNIDIESYNKLNNPIWNVKLNISPKPIKKNIFVSEKSFLFNQKVIRNIFVNQFSFSKTKGYDFPLLFEGGSPLLLQKKNNDKNGLVFIFANSIDNEISDWTTDSFFPIFWDNFFKYLFKSEYKKNKENYTIYNLGHDGKYKPSVSIKKKYILKASTEESAFSFLNSKNFYEYIGLKIKTNKREKIVDKENKDTKDIFYLLVFIVLLLIGLEGYLSYLSNKRDTV